MKKNIAIIAGGNSSEVEVSLKSAKGIFSFIDGEKYNKYIVTIERKQWQVEVVPGFRVQVDKSDFSFLYGNRKVFFDFAYITIHGTPGEDGKLEGYFDLVGVPYSTCDVLTSALTFNKFACNHYLSAFKAQLPDLNIAKSILVRKGDKITGKEIVSHVGLPCFVKPNAGGSSFGVSKVKNVLDFQKAIKDALKESDEVVIEEYIQGTEVTCGCFKTAKKRVVFPITEVVTSNEFFDYNAKYNGEVQEITPARISIEMAKRISNLTSDIYTLLGCKGIIRIDYILSEEAIFILEINTTPGMTETSFIPQQIRAAKLKISDVMDDIIQDILKDTIK